MKKQCKATPDFLMMLEAVKYSWVETHNISATLLIALSCTIEEERKKLQLFVDSNPNNYTL